MPSENAMAKIAVVCFDIRITVLYPIARLSPDNLQYIVFTALFCGVRRA